MANQIVLIHGAWQGSWAFEAWTPYLHARGWHPHGIELPGNGWGTPGPASLAAYVDHVCAKLEAIGEPVVLLGHSGGGLIATAVAERAPELVTCIVYLAGMMLPPGMRYAELIRQVSAEYPGEDLSGIGARLEWTPGRRFSVVPQDAALEVFLHDCEITAARRAASMLRPQDEAGRAITVHWTASRAGTVPRVYVEARQDRSVPHVLQKRMQELVPGAHRISLNCGHVPQLARPEELTEELLRVLTNLRSELPHGAD
ncbi:alpha/beta hydrolase [Comamonas aquatica]|uniref:Alpha/beta hydrolase n=1 Tax=Comamonas aquatica TaxID=225991 RepID=A0AA42W7Q7_9BURK|nr:alpha/beta hydrolase [Comamonas aquatica]MDH0496358.1 alpha/beta hydrolase [Comamonas aquatica]MDH1428423.1 alpha/beta hydrolase [Comamonas aquatica]MDH1607673.1 alpha/beta hydrolase [Comamonas aquatica]MDH1619429.1 alpha/beta hydrolase [Comamonas aquatica]MDH2007411.1 alpha/beta hydrolase [Comamonas aquatica]